MGRRKIEIKAIKDDRNRSVTFLKRKGGLFKKAHELSVLTSVDVAVIIFGHNNKLFEYCSSKDLPDFLGRYQYARGHYGGAHEHKGPDDYNDTKDDDDEDEDGADDQTGSHSPPSHPHSHNMMSHHLQSQPSFQHLQSTPSASPPMPNGAFLPRQSTPHSMPMPQMPHIIRPDSRTHARNGSTGIELPTGITQAAPGQGPSSYTYMPNPAMYNAQNVARSQPQFSPPLQHHSYPPHAHPHPHAHAHPHPHPHPHSHQQQAPQMFAQDHRLMVPTTQPQHSPELKAPQHLAEPQHAQFQSPPLPQPKPLPASKSHSIFTPIDDSRSLLARHWDAKPEPRALDSPAKTSDARSQSLDVATMKRAPGNLPSISQGPAPTSNPPQPPQRTNSTPVISTTVVGQPNRTNSMQSDAKRPRLKVQIPADEDASDGTPKSASAGSPATQRSQRDINATLTPIREGPVLPPPSPSASALLSAGATGPRNPFARPPPPAQTNGNNDRNDIATPISALPSRFINEQLLPSPSSFMPEWNFGRGDSAGGNLLPSPMNFQTPVNASGPSFARPDASTEKRKADDGDGDGDEAGAVNSQSKRVKT